MKFKQLTFLLMFSIIFTPMISFTQSNEYSEDFLEFWNEVNDNYAYFDKKNTDWNKVKTLYLSAAENAKDRNKLITVFENALEELYDDHFSLNTNLRSSTRLVPSGLDIWAEWTGGKAIITEVRKGFSADYAGLKCGMEIISINGIPVEQAVKERSGKCISGYDAEAFNYVLRMLLAGNYLMNREISVNENGQTKVFKPDEDKRNLTDNYQYNSLLDFSILNNNTGYIKINNSLGETDLIPLFDTALFQLKKTKALIIDLRETPGGGNSIVARGILGRFISNELPYQKHVLPEDEKLFNIKRSWLELVTPRGPFIYERPVVILVNHWTGSMGEGIAIGFSALGRAKITGTKMAGLNGAISRFQTTNTKIPYSFPTEQLFHINGTPRENFVPDMLLDLTNPEYINNEDPVLYEGMKVLN